MDNLVSCILPTYNRQSFFRQALRCFLRQTWDNSELVVVDDGDDPVEDICRGVLRVRYVRLANRTNLGAKLNIGIEHAQGDVIQKLDDDDYYHPEFLEFGVKVLGSSSQCSITAWDCFLVLLAGEDRVRYSGHGWTAGGTLLFRRAQWKRAGFRDIPRAVDEAFLNDHPGAARRVCAPDLYMLVRHGGNTWTTMHGSHVDDQFSRLPVRRKLVDVIEPIDRAFYCSLRSHRLLQEASQ